MPRLQVRVYRTVGQSDRWAMVGGTESRKQIEQWLEEYSNKGLIFHTGVSVLPREVLVELLEHSQDGIVVCAATKAIFSELFNSKNVQGCYGLDDDGALPFSYLDSWFFKLSSEGNNPEGKTELWLVGEKPQTSNTISKSLPAFNDLSKEFRESLKKSPELADALLGVGITNIEQFRTYWTLLPIDSAFEVAKALMSYGQESFEERLKREKIDDEAEESNAIVHIVRYLPPWDSEVPNTPVRLYNAMRIRGVDTLYKLEHENPTEILKIPNLGKKSMLSLYEYLINYEVSYPFQVSSPLDVNKKSHEIERLDSQLEQETSIELGHFELAEAPSLAELLDVAINNMCSVAANEKTKRSFLFLKRRFSGDTLESIAEDEKLTRERIRQITDKSLKQFATNLAKGNTEPSQNLKRLLILMETLYEKDSCSHVEFSNFIRIFTKTKTLDLSTVQRRMLEKLNPESEIKLIPFELASTSVVLPVITEQPERLYESLESIMKDLLYRIHGMKTRDAEAFAKQQFLSVLDSSFWASLLALEAVLYRSSIDDSDTVKMVAERMSSEQAVERIIFLLREAGRTMHAVDEIYPSMPRIYRDSVNFRRVSGHIHEHQERCSSTNPDFIFTMGRGRYGLWEHFDISDDDGKRCAQFIEQHVNNYPERQFTDHDLYKILNDRKYVTWYADHVDRYRIVSAILMRYRPSKVRYLGRFVWGAGEWTDQSDTSRRYQIHELIEEYIKEKGQPVSKQQLDDYISKVRGRCLNVQYHDQNGVIRLGGVGKNALYWHESMDPIPFDSSESKALREEIVNLVANLSSSGVFMLGLKADVVKYSDVVSQFSSAQFLALLLRMPEIRIAKNGQNQLIVHDKAGTFNG